MSRDIKIYEAVVTRNTDIDLGTQLRGAVFFKCDQLLEDQEYPDPAYPLFMHNWFDVPEIDNLIEIEIDISIEKPQPRWRSIIYNLEDELPEEFKTNYPHRRGIITDKGHMLYFDDKVGNEFVKFMHLIGSGIEIDKLGTWTEEIVKDKIVEIIGNYSLDAGIKATIKAAIEAIIDAPTVKLGESPQTFHATLSENVISSHDIHQHPPIPPVVGGPVLPPLIKMADLAGTPLDPTALKIFLAGNV